MYRLKRLWLLFRSHIGFYIFAWVQLTAIIFILSSEVMMLEKEYNRAYFIEKYSPGMYLYANVMNSVIENMNPTEAPVETMGKFIKEIEQIKGVKGVGYNIYIGQYVADGTKTDVLVSYINEVMDDISYKGIDGEWLTEAEYSEEYISIVIGNSLNDIYDIGDIVHISHTGSGKQHKCKVVGVFDEKMAPVSLNMAGSAKRLYVGEECTVYTNDPRIMEGIDAELMGFPMSSLLLSLDNDYEEEALLKYGNLYSFEYLDNANDDYFSFLFTNAFQRYGVLLFVIIFGMFTTVYLTLSKGMYRIGVYSLLGQSKRNIIMDNLIVYLAVYVCSAITVFALYMCSVDERMIELFGTGVWTLWNTLLVVGLGVITLIIAIITNICMIHKHPNNIINAAKVMEG